MKNKILVAIIFLIVSCSLSFAQSKIKVIKAGKPIDVVSGTMLKNQIIIVDSNKIIEIGADLPIPKDAEVIDLSKYTVLPGLIDCHTHLTWQSDKNYYESIFKETPLDLAIVAHIYAKRTLDAGFTMVRNMGDHNLIDIALRNAINKGTIPGPRMLVSTFMISSTGGHDDFTGFNPNIEWKGNKDFTGVADSVDEIRRN